MERKDSTGWIGILIGGVFGILSLFLPYFTKSPNQQVWIVIGAVAFVAVIALVIIISKKFNELNDFTKMQEEINRKNEERFKIYERLSILESRLNLIERGANNEKFRR